MDENQFELAALMAERAVESAIASRVQYAGESADECVECSAEIPQARREAVPGVELCVECASVAEEAGRHRRG